MKDVEGWEVGTWYGHPVYKVSPFMCVTGVDFVKSIIAVPVISFCLTTEFVNVNFISPTFLFRPQETSGTIPQSPSSTSTRRSARPASSSTTPSGSRWTRLTHNTQSQILLLFLFVFLVTKSYCIVDDHIYPSVLDIRGKSYIEKDENGGEEVAGLRGEPGGLRAGPHQLDRRRAHLQVRMPRTSIIAKQRPKSVCSCQV